MDCKWTVNISVIACVLCVPILEMTLLGYHTLPTLHAFSGTIGPHRLRWDAVLRSFCNFELYDLSLDSPVACTRRICHVCVVFVVSLLSFLLHLFPHLIASLRDITLESYNLWKVLVFWHSFYACMHTDTHNSLRKAYGCHAKTAIYCHPLNQHRDTCGPLRHLSLVQEKQIPTVYVRQRIWCPYDMGSSL